MKYVKAIIFGCLAALAAAQMTKESILLAMEDSSKTMAKLDSKFTLIVQGGAVNVILGNREETGDMDFLATNYKPMDPSAYGEVLDKLKRGWLWAYTQAKKRQQPIPSNWVDTSISIFFNRKEALFKKFTSEAEAQATILSTAGMDKDGTGIKFIAAPWDWQFVSKMVQHEKDYDLDDATFYLQQWLKKVETSSISYDRIAQWFSAWSFTVPSDLAALCKEINRKGGAQLITGNF
ncbi:RNase domain-containing protein [Purpureocillium lilacinum]|uniref:RNase domain-containing protein n=1 Tax=Purpureocillium lilacinum TaxID=33203 RepID=A0A179EZ15_PURLI|nr:RNase domain-containing protein [Purpureocillium lilacinum]